MPTEKTVRVVRTLEYIGNESWVDMCIERAFVKLEKELGQNHKIISSWGEKQDVE